MKNEKKLWSVVVAVLLCALSHAHGGRSYAMRGFPDRDTLINAVLYLTGASDAESVPESEMERWWALADAPLEINLAGRSRLESSGLMSPYQTASLLDYRSRCGDVLSVHELASLDGFGPETAWAMSPFISFVSRTLPGRSSDAPPRIRNSLYVNESNKAAIPFDGSGISTEWNWTGKYRVNAEGRFDSGVALRRSYGAASAWPSSGSGFVAFYGRRHVGKIVAGDYSLRFGQGLALWTGFSMSGASSLQAFWKRPSGISPSYSLSASSSMRGVAAGFESWRFSVSLFSSVPGLRGWMESGRPFAPDMVHGVNAVRYFRHGQVSATVYGMFGKVGDHIKDAGYAIMVGRRWCMPASKVSADARFSIRGVELFGETALDVCSTKPAVLAGFVAPVGSRWKLGASGRHIADGYDLSWCAPVRAWSGSRCESGVSAGVSYSDKTLTADWAVQPETGRQQVKVHLVLPFRMSEAVSMILRIQERWRSYGVANRTDVRADVRWDCGGWRTSFRAEMLASRATAWLGYAEEGYEWHKGAVFLRGTLFRADSWDDRIYVYERDAPGSFNVPAYYGRGYSVSVAARLKFVFRRAPDAADRHGWRTRTMKAYLRAGYADTPWFSPGQSELRPAKAELKFQLMYDF